MLFRGVPSSIFSHTTLACDVFYIICQLSARVIVLWKFFSPLKIIQHMVSPCKHSHWVSYYTWCPESRVPPSLWCIGKTLEMCVEIFAYSQISKALEISIFRLRYMCAKKQKKTDDGTLATSNSALWSKYLSTLTQEFLSPSSVCF